MYDPTPERMLADHELLRRDPQKYVEMITGFIDDDPNDAHAHFSRHQGLQRLGRFDEALADIDKAISLEESVIKHIARGELLCSVGRYREALSNFNRSEELDPEKWLDAWGALHRADCHARLGNETAALADCTRLADDFWSPGIHGEPRGNKAEITAEIRRRARAANQPRLK
jgi:tetratricopeptide (TPR) repeat protein